MSPTRALPVVALAVAAALAAAASAAPAAPPAPAAPAAPAADQADQPDDAPDTNDDTNSLVDEEIKYPEGSSGPEQPGWGEGSARLFSQLVAPLVQFVVNQLLQAANLVGALAGAGRPNDVLSLFSRALGAASGGFAFPGRVGAPAGL